MGLQCPFKEYMPTWLRTRGYALKKRMKCAEKQSGQTDGIRADK
jgi:hypothetical protein